VVTLVMRQSVALAASLVLALRAARLDPVTALRCESVQTIEVGS
jgi:ABC-type lipoprotein release transport system permease subunit